MQKKITFKTRGMQRDLSASAFSPEFSYENMNIRLIATDGNTSLSIVNERGPLKVFITITDIEGNSSTSDSIKGIVIGKAIINKSLVLFSKDTDKDIIYKIQEFNGTLYGEELYIGNLNFDIEHPIETLISYENDSIQKVYWTDGLNPPRVINISEEADRSKWDDTFFDFISTLEFKESVSVTKNQTGGSFASGVIQYAFTYISSYGRESSIFHTSPLNYISYADRGASPEDTVNNSFTIEISNLDTSFDYVRIYSIQRTSIDATPYAKRVIDLQIPTNKDSISFIDTGLYGDAIDPTELLFVGGEEIVCGTMTQKDNTLFLGDIETKVEYFSSDFKSKVRGLGVTFRSGYKTTDVPSPTGYYPYKNQLDKDSQKIRHFKYLEYYRFGIQLQHKSGKWSEPLFIRDVQCTTPIEDTFYNDSSPQLPTAVSTITDSEILSEFNTKDYIKIRPVVVYPSINERGIICQGILCPTIYNVKDRYDNAPFSQSSWFVRPNAPFDFDKTFTEEGSDWYPLGNYGGSASLYSKAGILINNKGEVDGTPMDVTDKGAWAEFRHNKPIPDNLERNAEIQCIWGPPESPYIQGDTSTEVSNWVNSNSENYYIDQSIITMHSPDIEFNSDIRNADLSNAKLRIVGYVPLTSFISDIDIQTSTPVMSFPDGTLPRGFYKEEIGVKNDFSYESLITYYGNSHFGWRGLISGAFWFDYVNNPHTFVAENKNYGYAVYPWHRNGSLNNTKQATDGYRSAMLDKKKMSNLKYSYKTQYFSRGANNIWNAYVEGDPLHTGLSGAAIFDSNEVTLVKLPKQHSSLSEDITYYGNIDKLLAPSLVGDKEEGYPIVVSGYGDDISSIFRGKYFYLDGGDSEDKTGIDPIRIKYKSTPHIIMALNYGTEADGTIKQRILPTSRDGDLTTTWVINDRNYTPENKRLFWDNSRNIGVSQDVLAIKQGPISNVKSTQHGYLWLGELYNDNIQNRFGGTSEEAIANNQWVPCGDAISLLDDSGNPKTSVSVEWIEGDTYYQRYDHIKTYPFTLEDQNAMTEIVSFMCETRVNLDGRYDRNRGQLSNLTVTPSNFNQVNEVYSQNNNFFNYRGHNSNVLNINKFPNIVTWTKTKTSGELVDSWTNITLASTLELDGDKGKVRALKRFNDNIIAFQDEGISQILYNENMQIATTEGVPIEIANSGKVNGKRYISDKVGCTNKWSICETPSGMYFIDNKTKGIFLFNGSVNNISDKFGFHSWMEKVSNDNEPWNPGKFNNFITYYDDVNKDVFFITKDECLAFSEILGQFSSFYSYENTPFFANINGTRVWIKDSKIWKHNAGEYNKFFDVEKPYYTTVIVNPNPLTDKIFSTIEFRADSYSGDTLVNRTFNTLEVWNEYQRGKETLTNIKDVPSNLKRKFRIWRANVPRSSENGRDRMRNPWLYIKLAKEHIDKDNINTDKTILHDMTVSYFE